MSLSGWNSNNKLKLVIDHSKVDEDLTNFPVLIVLSSGTGITNSDVTKVFDELSTVSGSKKIAITTSLDAQCPIEIDRWDWANEEAYLWTKIPTISSGTDTELYLYYDSTHADNTAYVGYTGETAAQQVWDSNFEGVWHLSQDPTGGAGCILDSTSNGRNYTPQGTMTAGDLVNTKVGKGLDFDGSNDYLKGSDWCYSNMLTIEAVQKPAVLTVSNMGIVNKRNIGTTSNSSEFSLNYSSDGKVYFIAWNDSDFSFIAVSSGASSTSAYSYTAGRCDGSEACVVLNDQFGTSVTQVGTIKNTSSEYQIGALSNNDTSRYFNGIIDEVRISNIARSDAWLKATYYSNFDNLIYFDVFSGYFSGTVSEFSTSISGAVIYVYNQTDGSFVGSTTSSGDGGFYIETTYSGAHFLVCVDPYGNGTYNNLIYGSMYPATISG